MMGISMTKKNYGNDDDAIFTASIIISVIININAYNIKDKNPIRL